MSESEPVGVRKSNCSLEILICGSAWSDLSMRSQMKPTGEEPFSTGFVSPVAIRRVTLSAGDRLQGSPASRHLLVVAAVVLVMVAARPSNLYGNPPPTYGDVPAEYQFSYGVKDDYSKNDYGHSEDRSGYNTQGQYQVLLPDGRLQTVEYTVTNDSGFVASVEAKGALAPYSG
ncbi:cuticle protein-like [Penaeus japonicus]|uniref:cuticle protein-like n=1 Tax=Penaeus japonicus TaxID=27405 RepID=UPI001C70CCB4|nr:cuticle protein-like [Penaeus japonicus]